MLALNNFNVPSHDQESVASADIHRWRVCVIVLLFFVVAATLSAVAKLSDADLDKPTTNMMAKYAPKLADLLILIANHTLMHGGQFTVIRRALGKPVVM